MEPAFTTVKLQDARNYRNFCDLTRAKPLDTFDPPCAIILKEAHKMTKTKRPAEPKNGYSRIARIRDTMQFEEEYSYGEAITLRIYSTKRAGTYGHQFAAILWDKNLDGGAASRKSTGGGYHKVGSVTSDIFHECASLATDSFSTVLYRECAELAASGRVYEAVAKYAGVDRSAIHHAHG